MADQETPTVAVYSLSEAARALGVSRWTLHRAIKDGKLAVHKSGGAVIIFASDLIDYSLSYRRGVGIPGA